MNNVEESLFFCFCRNCEEEANKCMDEMDLDKDGKVSYAEFVLRWRVS